MTQYELSMDQAAIQRAAQAEAEKRAAEEKGGGGKGKGTKRGGGAAGDCSGPAAKRGKKAAAAAAAADGGETAEGGGDGAAPAAVDNAAVGRAASTRELLPLMDAELRDYQLKGVKWLIALYVNDSNGILADQMGLGKTIQAIGFISFLRTQGIKGPFLVRGLVGWPLVCVTRDTCSSVKLMFVTCV